MHLCGYWIIFAMDEINIPYLQMSEEQQSSVFGPVCHRQFHSQSCQQSCAHISQIVCSGLLSPWKTKSRGIVAHVQLRNSEHIIFLYLLRSALEPSLPVWGISQVLGVNKNYPAAGNTNRGSILQISNLWQQSFLKAYFEVCFEEMFMEGYSNKSKPKIETYLKQEGTVTSQTNPFSVG